MSDSQPHVLIIGAGPGGLTLAQGLKRSGIPFTLFEQDASLDSRRQGYRLKISGDVAARLQSTVLPETWATIKATCAATGLGETNLNATDAAVTASRKQVLSAGDEPPLAVDRGLLRWALSQGIHDHLRFGKRLVSYRFLESDDDDDQEDAAGLVEALFADGSTARGNLLVGADGSRSAVRAQHIPTYEFIDTDVCCVYGKSTLNAELRSRFPERHRRWITVVQDRTPIIQGIINKKSTPVTMVCEPCQFSNRDAYPHLPEDYVHFGIMFPKELLGRGLSDHAVDERLRGDAHGVSLDITSEWDPSVRSLVELQDRELTYGMRILTAPAAIPSWETSGRVTALGDAVHVMSPAGGVGAVAALHDAVTLATIIRDEGVSVSSLKKFEDAMKEFSRICLLRTTMAGSRMLNLPA